MVADGIARLEQRVEAAEKRAREAEASAKEARAALAEVLVAKAKSQTGARSDKDQATPDDRDAEVQALRTELDAARHELRHQETRMRELRDDVADELRREYEHRFHAARERMAREFQKRVGGSPRVLDATQAGATGEQMARTEAGDPQHEAQAPPAGAPTDSGRSPLYGLLDTRNWQALRRHAIAVPLAAFVGGLIVGWAVLPGTSGSEPAAVLTSAAPADETTPAPSSPPEVRAQPSDIAGAKDGNPATNTDLPPPATAGIREPESAAPVVADTSQVAPAEPSTAAEPVRIAEPLAMAEPKPILPAAQTVPPEERQGVPAAELEALRSELDAASKRAAAAEAALAAERRKATELARRAAAAERSRDEQTQRAAEAVAATRRQAPQPKPAVTEIPNPPTGYYGVE